MKATLFTFTMITFFNFYFTFGQSYQGDFEEIFLLREPSTSAEASGKIFLLSSNDAFASTYNPSLPAFTNNLNISASNSEKLYFSDKAFYHSFTLNIPISALGVVSASRRYFDYGEEFPVTSVSQPDGTGESGRISEAIYNINFSRRIIPEFYLGFGINYIHSEFIINNYDHYSAGLGLSYIHDINRNVFLNQRLFVGLSAANIFSYSSNNKIKLYQNEYYSINLPQMLRYDLGYMMEFNSPEILNDMKNLIVTLQAEYMDVLNSGRYSRYSFGSEIKFLEILCARMGYYSFDDTHRTRDDFTYGAGIIIPVYYFTAIPLSVGIDYTNLPQEAGSPYFKFQNFNSLTITINYKF